MNWDSIFPSRIQVLDAFVDEWFPAMTDGPHPIYVSDGNPDIVTMPFPLPGYLTDQFDITRVVKWGLELLEYDPETGTIPCSSATDPDRADKHRNSDDEVSGDNNHRNNPPRH